MIVTSDVIAMIEHWLFTPPNGYFGSSYGADLNGLLLRPLNSTVADEFIAKMKTDIPILAGLDSSQLALYSTAEGFEKRIIVLSVGTITINLNNVQNQLLSEQGETYDANAS
ncbi:hypothetical protein GCM10023206_06880 [Acinetobacter puyangensis]|uniref:Uncharacterized protein n=2 Tax=Acinetobacter puyangensis TaxID=1096779 RepID=A0A240E7L1_9GAMM|nr:hypothetical protein SAMN05421731_102394 [Acinetobacter puyangensis]